jgi:hypothetical protein
MVLVVLGAFAAGLTVGILGMVPRWWRQRQTKPAAPVLPDAVDAGKSAKVVADAYSDSAFHGI